MFITTSEMTQEQLGIIAILKDEESNMKEFDVLFWCNWFERYSGLDISDFSDLNRSNMVKEEKEKRVEMLEEEFKKLNVGNKVAVDVVGKEGRKIVKRRTNVENELAINSRAMARLDRFSDSKEFLSYVLRVGMNKFSLMMLAIFIEKQVAEELNNTDGAIYWIAVWLKGMISCDEAVRKLSLRKWDVASKIIKVID